jgi:hypothetical protein
LADSIEFPADGIPEGITGFTLIRPGSFMADCDSPTNSIILPRGSDVGPSALQFLYGSEHPPVSGLPVYGCVIPRGNTNVGYGLVFRVHYHHP